MKKTILILLAVTLLTTGCFKKKVVVVEEKKAEEKTAQEKTAMGNPAAINCQNKGGVSQIKTRADGSQYGLCFFNDKACEEWAMYHGDCPVGGLALDQNKSEAEKYCSLVGGTLQSVDCKLANGKICAVADLFAGQCQAATTQENPYITVKDPKPGQLITSPLSIIGQARGPWYFEGSFVVELHSSSGVVLTQAQAAAQGEWMTDDFVPFETILKFDTQGFTEGELVFKKSNPSDLPQNNQSYIIPVKLEAKK